MKTKSNKILSTVVAMITVLGRKILAENIGK